MHPTADNRQQLKVTALLWVMVAGVCAVLANVIAAEFLV